MKPRKKKSSETLKNANSSKKMGPISSTKSDMIDSTISKADKGHESLNPSSHKINLSPSMSENDPSGFESKKGIQGAADFDLKTKSPSNHLSMHNDATDEKYLAGEVDISNDEVQFSSTSNTLHNIEEGAVGFEMLEKDFQSILNRLASEDHLETFRSEYKRLHNALVLSHENEIRLIKKCDALNQEIIANATRVAMALKISHEDQETINRLKGELKKAWDMVESAVESESQTQIEMNRLHRELKSAEEIISRYKATDDQYAIMEELKKENLKLVEQNSKLTDRIKELYSDYDMARDKSAELENLYSNAQRELKVYKTENQMFKLEQDKRDRFRKALQDTVTDQKQKLTDLDSELTKQLEQILSYQHLVDQHKLTIKEKNDLITSKERELQNAFNESKKLERALKKQVEDNASLTAEKRKQQYEYDYLRQENLTMSSTLRSLRKDKGKLELEVNKLNELHNASREHIKELQHDIEALNTKLFEYQRKAIGDAMTIDSLKLKISKYEENKLALTQKIKDEESNVIVTKQHVGKLRKHVSEMQENAKKLKEETMHLHKEKELTLDNQHKYMYRAKQLEDELTVYKLERDVYTKTISDLKHKLVTQRAQYEQVRSDRAAISFRLRQSKDVLTDHQQKLSFTRQQLDQLRSEIVTFEGRITELSKEKEVFLKEKSKLASTVTEKMSEISNLKSTIQILRNENENLRQMVQNSDVARKFEIIRFNEMVRDRDLLGTQVIKRNDHIVLLKKKIRIQESIFSKSSIQFEKKLKDEQLLKLKIKELEHKLFIFRRKEMNNNALKEALKRSKEVCENLKTQVIALSQELDIPQNVHRWRLTSGKDEDKFELMQRTQLLQKELLSKRQELFDVQQALIEKDQLLNQYKRRAKNSPDAEAQLHRYEDTVRKLKDKLKSLTSELNIYAFQAKEKEFQMKQARVQYTKTSSHLLPIGSRQSSLSRKIR